MADGDFEWMPATLAELMEEIEWVNIEDTVMIMSSSKPTINIAYPSTSVPTANDVEFILSILSMRDVYISTAVNFLCKEMKRDPEFFGINADDVDGVIANGPVEIPTFTFYMGKDWVIGFQEGKFKIAEEFGVIVSFDGEQPTEIVDLSKAEGWYDPDTKEFVPY